MWVVLELVRFQIPLSWSHFQPEFNSPRIEMWCFQSSHSLRILKCHSSPPEVKIWVGENFLGQFFNSPCVTFTLCDACLLCYTMSSVQLLHYLHHLCSYAHCGIYNSKYSRFSNKIMLLLFRRGVTPSSCTMTPYWVLFHSPNSHSSILYFTRIGFTES